MNIHTHAFVGEQIEEGRDQFIRSQLSSFGLRWLGKVSWNEANARLVQKSVAREESRLSATGALVVETGVHTGRSPKDKFIVLDDESAGTIWWNNNRPLSRKHFDSLKLDMLQHARLRDVFVQDLVACPGAEPGLSV